ncbi:hypothetical protein GCM10010406_52910 [Streptomyces thermolineatus]|uniref:Phage tail protein n=1 Tax=Streptomyces thermolineatus TaxID=44033 RepID=A0ABN3MWT2_9ACTN
MELDGLRATLGDLRLGETDTAGVTWHLQSLEGWDGAEVRGQMTERQADHGASVGPVYYGARPITLAGTVVAPDRAALDLALDRLRAAVPLTDTALTVWEALPKMAWVRASGRMLAQYVSDRAATYSVMVTAADPRRYGLEVRTESARLPQTTGGIAPPLTPPLTIAAAAVSGTITAVNEGSFETRPVLILAGPCARPVVTVTHPDGTTDRLAYALDLDAGEVLTIDAAAHTVVLNGTVSRRRFLTGPWPVLPPGEPVAISWTANTYSPDAQLTVSWRPAWT